MFYFFQLGMSKKKLTDVNSHFWRSNPRNPWVLLGESPMNPLGASQEAIRLCLRLEPGSPFALRAWVDELG